MTRRSGCWSSVPTASASEARASSLPREVGRRRAENDGRRKDWRMRLRALWTLDGIDAIEPAHGRAGPEDRLARCSRVDAVRLAERWLGGSSQADPRGGAETAGRRGRGRPAAAGRVGGSDAAPRTRWRAAAVLERHGDDPITVDAALSGLAGSEADVLDLLLRATRRRHNAGGRHDACGNGRAQRRGRGDSARPRMDGPREPDGVAAFGPASRRRSGAAWIGVPGGGSARQPFRRQPPRARRARVGEPVPAAPTRTRRPKTSCARG